MRVYAAGSLVCIALAVVPAATVLLPPLTGRSLFAVMGLPLDDALPPLVAGGLLCAAWALRGVGLGSLGAVPAGSGCRTAPPPFVQRPNACR
ncbi:unnamed protein product, partial [Ectocarpus sp. 12 AP-2014]